MQRLSIHELREQISSGKQLKLTENYLYQGRVYIPKDRILTPRDVERLENQGQQSVRVTEWNHGSVDRSDKESILNGVLKLFHDHH